MTQQGWRGFRQPSALGVAWNAKPCNWIESERGNVSEWVNVCTLLRRHTQLPSHKCSIDDHSTEGSELLAWIYCGTSCHFQGSSDRNDCLHLPPVAVSCSPTHQWQWLPTCIDTCSLTHSWPSIHASATATTTSLEVANETAPTLALLLPLNDQ